MNNLKFKLAKGGKVEGPSHSEGGIEAIDQNGNSVAEIEGGERLFSVDDTEEIETRVSEISRALAEDDQDLANQLATSLGHKVVEMVARQERINPS